MSILSDKSALHEILFTCHPKSDVALVPAFVNRWGHLPAVGVAIEAAKTRQKIVTLDFRKVNRISVCRKYPFNEPDFLA